MNQREQIIKDVLTLSENYTKIINVSEINKNSLLKLKGNGIGDRWANKLFHYISFYSNKKYKFYTENREPIEINQELISNFYKDIEEKVNKIVGILPVSLRTNKNVRPIKKEIIQQICSKQCVVCGSSSEIICDHKNDHYNDEQVLNVKTQKLEDFQPLCNHCNLQKRQIYKVECETKKLYSIKNIPQFSKIKIQLPWDFIPFDKKDIKNKEHTYWYDPIKQLDMIEIHKFKVEHLHKELFYHKILLKLRNL